MAASTDARTAARSAGLRYVKDGAPGLRRSGAGKGFFYVTGDGRRIGDRAVLARIRALATRTRRAKAA